MLLPPVTTDLDRTVPKPLSECKRPLVGGRTARLSNCVLQKLPGSPLVNLTGVEIAATRQHLGDLPKGILEHVHRRRGRSSPLLKIIHIFISFSCFMCAALLWISSRPKLDRLFCRWWDASVVKGFCGVPVSRHFPYWRDFASFAVSWHFPHYGTSDDIWWKTTVTQYGKCLETGSPRRNDKVPWILQRKGLSV